MKKINDLNDEIDLNKKKEGDFMKEVKAIADQIAQLDKQIKEKQIEFSLKHSIMNLGQEFIKIYKKVVENEVEK